MSQKTEVVFLSGVGGGPISRIVGAIAARSNVNISSVNAFSTTEWKRARGLGAARFLKARLELFFAYPLKAMIRAIHADVVIATTNPFWLPNVLLATRWLHRSRVITLVYDVYPDSLALPSGRLPLLRRTMHRLNMHWTHKSTAVVYISTSMQRALTARYGSPMMDAVIVTGTDCAEFETIEEQTDLARWAGDRILLSYVGNAGHAHDVHTLTEIIAALTTTHGDAIAVLCAATGVGASWLDTELTQLAIPYWSEPVLSEDRWRWVQSRTDIALVSLSETTAVGSMPSKYFSALGAKSAILAVAPEASDLHTITAENQLGVTTRPDDAGGAMEDLRRLLDVDGALSAAKERAHQTASRDFDVTHLAAKWETVIAYCRMTGDRPNNSPAPERHE